MAIVGAMVDAALVPFLTHEFPAFKRRHFPHRFEHGHALSDVLAEVKGSELVQMARHSSRGKRRRALLARSEFLELLERYGCRVIGRVWVKRPGVSLKPTETYTVAVAHSVFTQKWRAGGDPYPPLMEVPLFAHSDNHAGLQIADLVATTLVFPMAASAYGAPAGCVHNAGQYHRIRALHGRALRDLQYQYLDEIGRRRGGIVVSDPIGKQPSSRLFDPPSLAGAQR